MGRASASLRVPGLASDAEALWYDPVRWPAWIDGFGHVVDLPDTWPASGRLAWDGVAQGRGRVLETVIAYEPRGGQTVAVEDSRLRGTQQVVFTPGPDSVDVTLVARVRAQGAQPAHPADRPAVHPPRDRRVAAPDARALRPRAARRRGVGGRDQPLGSTPMFVFKAAVVGAGVMGGEIAQVIAAADIPVVLKDVEQKFVDTGLAKAREVTQGQVGKLVKKGKLTEEQAAAEAERILANITGATSYDGFGDVDFAIEAVPEKMAIKHAVFAELDAATPGHAVLASNTSGLSITEIADATQRPDKVVGFHFFWPASYMRVIEVIEGEDTSAETVQAASTFAQQIRKVPIRAAECPGFVVNRILVSTASEAWRYQDETGIDVEQLDEFIKERTQMPMGPFRVADMSGLDTVVKVARDMRDAYGDRFYVHKGMEERVERGDLGAKTGKGFYEHR